jgi:hypothetical protein
MTTRPKFRIQSSTRYTNMLARLLSCLIKFIRSRKCRRPPQIHRISTHSFTKLYEHLTTALPISWRKRSLNLFKRTTLPFLKNWKKSLNILSQRYRVTIKARGLFLKWPRCWELFSSLWILVTLIAYSGSKPSKAQDQQVDCPRQSHLRQPSPTMRLSLFSSIFTSWCF